jgi:hypothetical protein
VVAQSKEAAFFWTFVTLMGGYGCREYFEDVSNTRAKFEQTLWGHIRNFFQLAKERCLFPFSINLRLSQFFKTMPKEMLATIQT